MKAVEKQYRVYLQAVGLYVLTFVATLAVGLLVQRSAFVQRSDSWLYSLIHTGPHYPIIELASTPFNYNILFHLPGDMPTFYYFLITGIFVYFWYKKQRAIAWWFLACIVIGNILVHIISLTTVELLPRTRPFLVLENMIDSRGYEAWKSLSSYPSGHSRDTALYSTIIALFVPRLRWAAAVLILFIGYSRVYLGAHYPIDVLMGTLIGCNVAFVVWRVSLELQASKVSQQVLSKLLARWRA